MRRRTRGSEAIELGERLKAAVGERWARLREIAAVMRPATFLALQRAGGDEAGGERHVGEDTIISRFTLDLAQRRDSLAQTRGIAHDPHAVRHRAPQPGEIG